MVSPQHTVPHTRLLRQTHIALAGLGGLGLESKGCSVISMIHNVRNRGGGRKKGEGQHSSPMGMTEVDIFTGSGLLYCCMALTQGLYSAPTPDWQGKCDMWVISPIRMEERIT